jgi:4'-phosphopantetheinyl transferase
MRELRGHVAEPQSALPLAEGVVDVWRVDLSSVGDDVAQLLCEAELARAARLTRASQRRQWMRCRGALRLLLGRYLACDPRALGFVAGPQGKPELEGCAGASFNLSHSGPLALFAFTLGAPVGVDIEVIDVRPRGFDEVAIAERAFGPGSARRLAALEPAARRREFLRLWVRHEAVLKCRGSGLLDEGDAGTSPEPWVCELDVGVHALAALAVQRGACELRHHDWASQPS